MSFSFLSQSILFQILTCMTLELFFDFTKLFPIYFLKFLEQKNIASYKIQIKNLFLEPRKHLTSFRKFSTFKKN